MPLAILFNRAVILRVSTLSFLGRRHFKIQTPQSVSQLCLSFISPSLSPRAKIFARDAEMAPKKNKSKLDVEEIPDLATGWRRSKMSDAAVQELEDMKLL